MCLKNCIQVPLKVEPKTSAWTKSEIDAAVLQEAQMANQVSRKPPPSYVKSGTVCLILVKSETVSPILVI